MNIEYNKRIKYVRFDALSTGTVFQFINNDKACIKDCYMKVMLDDESVYILNLSTGILRRCAPETLVSVVDASLTVRD